MWDLGAGRTVGVYFADATPGAVELLQEGRRVFVGDTAGFIHILTVEAPTSNPPG